MAKGKNDPSPANDYLEQVQWQSRHHHRFWPLRYEPKWKYKIVYRTAPSAPFDKVGQAIVWLAFFAVAIFMFLSDSVTTGEKIFFGAVFGLILTILFYALRDGAKANDRDAEEQDDE